MMEQKMNKELLSAMVDGELRGEELEQALACAESAEGCASWELYHLVGDVLRSPDLAHHSQHNLLTGLRAQLAQEPALQLQSSQLQQVGRRHGANPGAGGGIARPRRQPLGLSLEGGGQFRHGSCHGCAGLEFGGNLGGRPRRATGQCAWRK